MAPQINGSVVKAFEILKLFSEQRPLLSASDVVAELGINAITAHRFLKTLEHVGAVVAEARGVYRLGYLFADLGDRVLRDDALAQVIQPHLNRVTNQINEAAMATVFRGDMVVCVARSVSRRALSVDIRVGSRLEAYCTAHGKLWLAHLPEAERRRYFADVRRIRFTRNTLMEEAVLAKELEAIAARGHAINDCEREDGIRAVAVPVRTRSGRMIAGLSVFGPSPRMEDAVIDASREALLQAAADIGNSLYGANGATASNGA
ncbi:IclR family transcriptional regulator [Stappia sp. MMSF_3263]|uniref:IclR family transcriptional regulator n=1 Tax=Stappia sp. MMSF_3263 TaxID=3046693 RepID=UPI00273FABDC|nr:IclR family transcriptional regulator [Stappia sp. MMSF_3263]